MVHPDCFALGRQKHWLEKRSDDRTRIRIGRAACPVRDPNRFDLPALAIAETYRDRGQTELLFI